MMHDARQPLRAFARGQTFYFVLDQRRHDVAAPQSEAAQNHYCHGNNRARQQLPHEKTALREESKDGIHSFRRFDSYRGNDHLIWKNCEAESIHFQPLGRQSVRDVLGDGWKMCLDNRLQANIGECLVRTVLSDFQVLHSSASINIKSESQSADSDEISLLIDKGVPAGPN